MKWIVYLLLLANLAFGLWSYRSIGLGGGSAQDNTNSDNDTLRLVLVKEFLADQKVASENAATSGSCYTLGPFKSVDDANSVRTELKTAGLTVKRRMTTDTAHKGFWVLLPPAASHAQARKTIDQLKAKGLKDYFLVANGDKADAISLGVFSKSDTAQRRFEQILKLGFKPVLEKVDLPRREYWLDWPVDQSLDPTIFDKINKQYKGVGQATRSCGDNS